MEAAKSSHYGTGVFLGRSLRVIRMSALRLLSLSSTSVDTLLQAGIATKPKAKWWEKSKAEPGVRLVQKGFHRMRH